MKVKKIIYKELEIWKDAYPSHADVLQGFAAKLYYEMRYRNFKGDKL